MRTPDWETLDSEYRDYRAVLVIEEIKQHGCDFRRGPSLPPGWLGHARDARNRIRDAIGRGIDHLPTSIY